jgi:hypothetical protein
MSLKGGFKVQYIRCLSHNLSKLSQIAIWNILRFPRCMYWCIDIGWTQRLALPWLPLSKSLLFFSFILLSTSVHQSPHFRVLKPTEVLLVLPYTTLLIGSSRFRSQGEAPLVGLFDDVGSLQLQSLMHKIKIPKFFYQ